MKREMRQKHIALAVQERQMVIALVYNKILLIKVKVTSTIISAKSVCLIA